MNLFPDQAFLLLILACLDEKLTGMIKESSQEGHLGRCFTSIEEANLRGDVENERRK
jgi:hypothetical protein